MAEPQTRRQLIEQLFEEAVELPPPRRAAWLAARCGADEALAHEVEALLAGLAMADGLLERGPNPIAQLADSLLPPTVPHRTFGPYRVLRELGRGGMGMVYLADRIDGQFRRQVALKLLLPGAHSGTAEARFLSERRILASFTHPHIAQLLDSGVAPGGVHYLVMEYVDGMPITDYCRRERLDVPARLRLFLDVCDAVHHAHRCLVLHRDIKPQNVLVTGTGQVKLLDFGIAKLLPDAETDADSALTRTGQHPMTPAYASPEQLRGEDLTTASDTYALGLLLYELLTESSAFGSAVDRNVTRLARDPDAVVVRPSQRPTAHARRLRGDLDAIVLMALRREPDHRYGSADLLAGDIRRHLDGRPVTAHRGTAAYHFSRFVRRHRVAVAMGAVASVAMVTATIVAVRQARSAARASQETADALRRSEIARGETAAVAGFLMGMFEPEDPSEGRRDSVSAQDLLRRGLRRAERLGDQPLAQARVYEALSRVQLSIGSADASRQLLSRALAIRQDALGPTDESTIKTLLTLSELYRQLGDFARADSVARRALSGGMAGRSALGQASSLRQLGMLAVYRGALAPAESLALAAVRVPTVDRAGDSLRIVSMQTLANVQFRRGHVEDAIATLREAERAARRLYGRPHPEPATVMMRLAEILHRSPSGRVEADSLARAAVDETAAAVGNQHTLTALALGNAAELLIARPGLATPTAMLRTALSIEERILGPADRRYGMTMLALAEALADEGVRGEAERVRATGVRIGRSAYGAEHPAFAAILHLSGEICLRAGDAAGAERDFRQAVLSRRRIFGHEALVTAISTAGLGRALVAARRVTEGDSLLVWSREVILRFAAPSHPDIVVIDSVRASLGHVVTARAPSR